MKRLKKMLLIHWYSYDRELIEFGNINFLTGNTASGKSTIIDALQLVLLGDTNGNFFNKAANDKSVRTLKSYLFGENGDDGETGFRYLRNGTFTSYVMLEFEDTEKNSSFFTGIVCDCYEDLHYDYKWVIADRMCIPDNLFTDEKTSTPYTLQQLKSRLRNQSQKNVEFIDTNKRYQTLILAKYGSLKRKYLTLLKKAVPFSPIADIEQFITESICDVKNNIEIEQMQSDIRQYKNLETDAIRTEERVTALKAIAEASRIYEADKERYHQQSYIILRAGQEEERSREAELKQKEAEHRTLLDSLNHEIAQLSEEIEKLEEEIGNLETEYHSSDLVRKQKTLEEEMQKIQEEITKLAGELKKTWNTVRAYGAAWGDQLERIGKTDFAVREEDRVFFGKMRSLKDTDLPAFDFSAASDRMEEINGTIQEFAFELNKRASQLKEQIDELTVRIDNLKKGIKPYPSQVTSLKRRLETGLFERFKKAVDVRIFAELLEIRDAAWRDAIEGYLDRQKFNLLIPENYYTAANEIYNRIKKEEKIYDTGLVDLGKLRKEFLKKPLEGSLAEEIETEDPDARLYADYLLGSVMKCEDVRELNRYRTAITKEVMLYKGYVSRRLNPARYADPFIGRRSLEILLENLTTEREAVRKEYEETAENHRIAKKAAETVVMSSFEAKQHLESVERGEKIPFLTAELEKKREEYDGLDFTYLNALKIRIEEKKKECIDKKEQKDVKNRLSGRTETELEGIIEEDIPRTEKAIQGIEEEIRAAFEENWIREVGEDRFQEARKQSEIRIARDGAENVLSFKDSFTRARNQTRTTMEKHGKERRGKRVEYNLQYRMPYDTEREDNEEYDSELHTLADIKLPAYIEQIKDAKEKAYDQFRDDFIAKLKSNIESVREQIKELNHSLKDSVFGTDRYRFVINPRAEYRSYYDMITDPMLMDTGGWNLASQNFNEKYQKEIDSLFKTLIINESDVSAERRAEYEKNIKKFTDYKTYLVFDLIVTNDQGEEQRLSKTLLKKSGGETQIPFYLALLASFSQICRIKVKGKNNTVRLIILDEAFSKMDGERIQEEISLLKRFGLQAIFSAPPEKIPDIAPRVDRNIAVYKSVHHSFTRYFDPAQIEEVEEGLYEETDSE